MGNMSPEIMMSELNLFWQHIFTWASWSIVLIMVAIAWRMGRKQDTPFYLLAIAAACLGAFVEPLYDVAFDLWFFDVHNGVPGAMFSHFTAFGIIQPNSAHSGYVILLEGTQVIVYTMAAVYFWRFVADSSRWALCGLFVIFQMTFLGSNFGLGAPIIIALHLSESAFSEALVWAGTLMSIGLCTLAVFGAGKLLPKGRVVQQRQSRASSGNLADSPA